MNISIILRFQKRFLSVFNTPGLRAKVLSNFLLRYKSKVPSRNNSSNFNSFYLNAFGLTYSINLFGFLKEDDETPNDKLINTIKRSILCIQREQYDKAEQMLHLALRMAQDIQNQDGVTYVYDIMANLAMEREQLNKAQTLFVDVMRRLLADGLPEDNPKVLHISSKLAHIAQLNGDIEKAKIGFTWTLAKIEECRKKMPEDMDVKELWGLTTNWFGQLLMKENNFKQAIECFKDAYDCFVQIHGSENEEAITILNNLSVACTHMENFYDAKMYLQKALDIAKSIKDTYQEAVLLANLGLIYLREGLIKEATTSCSQAWKSGKAQQYDAAIKQAEYCLDEIKAFSKNDR